MRVSESGPNQAIRGQRAVPVSPRALWLVLGNGLLAIAGLTWLLPSPWGGLVPVCLLAQIVGYRHGLAAAVTGLVAGGALGAGVGQLLGMEDSRRAAFAMLLLLLPSMIAWPARANSARG